MIIAGQSSTHLRLPRAQWPGPNTRGSAAVMPREVVPPLDGESGWQGKTSGSGVEMSRSPLRVPEVFMSHATALLTPRTRVLLADLIVGSHSTCPAAW